MAALDNRKGQHGVATKQGEPPMPVKLLCIEYTDGDYPVRLVQTGFDRFTVEYGKQVKRTMSYAEAGAEFGLCCMHSAACAGKLDNRTPAQARKDGDTLPRVEAI